MELAGQRGRRKSPFEEYLRSGRRFVLRGAVEYKYNHNHDPTNGQFTFAAGKGGFRGGGGSFGGAGATGDWSPLKVEPKKPKTKPIIPKGGSGGGGGASGSFGQPVTKPGAVKPTRQPNAATVPHPIAATAKPKTSAPTTRRVSKNGYDFEIDASGRTQRASGTLRLVAADRSRSNQANAGKPDRRSTDHGGHYIAVRFNGPRDEFNHFAQDANFNRGAYRALEDRWAKAIKQGKTVRVSIRSFYRATSRRPSALVVKSTIGGKVRFESFRNRRGGI